MSLAAFWIAGCTHNPDTKRSLGAPQSSDAGLSGKFERDRKAILSMAGNYAVNFNFHETLRFDPTAPVSEPEDTDANEMVIVVEDTGDFISLQHLLMVGGNQVVKHWRQDWRYEDPILHEFKGQLTWQPVTLPVNLVRGTWSQTVYQVDDSPRYEGYGTWVHVGDYSYWDSNETWRPLPRREYTHRDDYDVLVGHNRHSITKDGWIHEQDNYKLRLRDGKREVVAREIGLNTYHRDTNFDFSAAKEYWQKTAPFWAEVRKAWASEYARNKPFYLIGDDNKDSLWRIVTAEADEFAKSSTMPEGGVARTIEARLREGIRPDLKVAASGR